ncbi:hypothetical protein PR048_013996 [Dryococelus australis]|uniref:YqaJ viral recombinase domain-containing protein n=1 Tax=Dryococelus australis TaxID=614101 RepID=A0ABQ9HTT1_9NEOP|nr:hypothetical protein PR048_013996 [Dryococelus australis]
MVTIVTVQKEAIFEVNHVPEMKANCRMSYHADSLIEDVYINCVELYNSHIANAVGDKRINICLRLSYQVSNMCIELETDEDYGPAAAVPDMPLDQLEVAKEEYVQKLISECIEEKRTDIECRTREQSSTHECKEEKSKRLTESNFVSSLSQICGYNRDKMGLEHENVALNELSKHLHIPFRRGELIIHPEHPFLGASPNALFNEDAIAEIKCPYSIKDMSPQEAYKQQLLTQMYRLSPIKEAPFTTIDAIPQHVLARAFYNF